MIQFSSTGTKGCVQSCSIYNLANLIWRSLSSVLKFIWLQVSYLFKYFLEDEKKDGAIERKRDRDHLKNDEGSYKV